MVPPASAAVVMATVLGHIVLRLPLAAFASTTTAVVGRMPAAAAPTATIALVLGAAGTVTAAATTSRTVRNRSALRLVLQLVVGFVGKLHLGVARTTRHEFRRSQHRFLLVRHIRTRHHHATHHLLLHHKLVVELLRVLHDLGACIHEILKKVVVHLHMLSSLSGSRVALVVLQHELVLVRSSSRRHALVHHWNLRNHRHLHIGLVKIRWHPRRSRRLHSPIERAL